MPKDWDSVKPHIERLYMKEDKALSEVIKLMRTEFGFTASLRAYRMRLSEWRYQKNAFRNTSGIQKRTSSPSHSNLVITQLNEQLDSYVSTRLPSTPGFEINPIFAPHASISGEVSNGPHVNLDRGSDPAQLYLPSMPRSYEYLDRLRLAIENRSLQDVTQCLALRTGLAGEQNVDGQTSLHYAASSGAAELIQPLLLGGARIDLTDYRLRTPLHLAIHNPETTKALLAFNSKTSRHDKDGNTPLHLAVNLCNMDEPLEGSTIDLLIRAGADINTTNRRKESPFYLLIRKLCEEGKHQIAYMILFLENNTNININTPDGEPLWSFLFRSTKFRWITPNLGIPSKSRNIDLKVFFLNCNFRLESTVRSKDVLQLALNTGILDNGHDYHLGERFCQYLPTESENANGDNALHCIFRMANPQALPRYRYNIQLLLDRIGGQGVSSITNHDGETPLQVLFSSENSTLKAKLEILELLSKRLDVDLWSDEEKILPIYLAARLGDVAEPIISFLLDYGRFQKRKGNDWKLQHYSPITTFASKVCFFWTWYYSFIEEGRYSELEDLSGSAKSIFPSDIFATLCPVVCSYAAQQLLVDAKHGLEEGTEPNNKFIAILRTCRRLNIKVDPSWYEYLLDFFP